jgi:hypothetical protein
MCVETGVGSGRIYQVNELHPSREEAERVAQLKADCANTDKNNFVCKTYHARLEDRDETQACPGTKWW